MTNRRPSPGVSRPERLDGEGLERLERQLQRGARLSDIVLAQWLLRYGEEGRQLLRRYGRYRPELEPAMTTGQPGTSPRVKRCPRCGSLFVCHSAEVAQCPCRRVELDGKLAAAIAGHYHDCLCVACLRALRAQEAGD